MGLSVWTKTTFSAFLICIGLVLVKFWVGPFICTIMNAEDAGRLEICKTET